jgi:hypothetical protein
VAGFGISGAEPWGSAATVLVSKMDLREISCEDGRWMELAQDRVQWRALVLEVLRLRDLSCLLPLQSAPCTVILSVVVRKHISCYISYDYMWVPVSTAWRVLG